MTKRITAAYLTKLIRTNDACPVCGHVYRRCVKMYQGSTVITGTGDISVACGVGAVCWSCYKRLNGLPISSDCPPVEELVR